MILMEQTMRWFGPSDAVTLSDIRQTGCTGVVTALHHIPVGDVWPVEEINKRKKEIEAAGLSWTVIESLPVHEDIKKQTGKYKDFIENYKSSIRNVAACGLKVITYNFMPILDWMRTDLNFTMPNGSKALRFEKVAFVAFDLFLLKRPNADKEYTPEDIKKAEKYFGNLSPEARAELYKTLMLGLPGSDDHFTAEHVLASLNTYQHIDSDKLKQHLFYFLQQVVPAAEQEGIKLAIHPDDPPYSVLGLPRVVCTEKDLEQIIEAAPSNANGFCFCTGSLGVRSENNLPSMIRKFGDYIHFLHLRNTKRDEEGNFFEADHLSGDTDMASVVNEVLKLMKKTGQSIPMRPDHGHQMLDDLKKQTYPGYSAIGRLKGLAELRGLEMGIARSQYTSLF